MNNGDSGVQPQTASQYISQLAVAAVGVVVVTLFFSAVNGYPAWWLLAGHLVWLTLLLTLIRLMNGRWARWKYHLRFGMVVLTIGLLYLSLGQVTKYAIPWSADAFLDSLDTALFAGISPALWAEAHTNVLIIEVMSLIYITFLPYLLINAVGQYYWASREHAIRFARGLMTVYALGYMGYLFVPAQGPIVFNAGELGLHPEGPLFHQAVQYLVNEIGGGPHGAFPSLHVAATSFICLYDCSLRRWQGFAAVPLVLGIAVSTVFTHYHYVVDLIAAAMLAVLGLWVAKRKF